MSFEQVKQLINIVENSNFVDFELDMKHNFYIKMSKQSNHSKSKINKTKALSLENSYNNLNETETDTETFTKEDFKDIAKNISEPLTIIPEAKEEIKGGNIVTSPIVGTFYSSSAPDKPPYVKVGDKVKAGDVLCIVEAMKVMNEITSKFDGEVAEILVNNEEMVQFEQPLFRIV